MRNTSNDDSGTIVQIYGEEYRVSGQGSGVGTRQAAACVDARMRAAAAQAPHLPRTSLAVLVAMELAAELLAGQDDRQQLLQRAADNIDRLSELVDQRSTLVSATSAWMEQRGGRDPAVRPPGPRVSPAANLIGTR